MIFPEEYNNAAISKVLFPRRTGFAEENGFALSLTSPTKINRPIQFFEAGKNAPTIILFPAPDADFPNLEEMAEGLLQQQINLLIIANQPWSKEKEAEVCLKNYADEGAILVDLVHSFLEERGMEEPLFLAGHGLGILPALTAMLRHVSFLKGILLEGPICDLPGFIAHSAEPAEEIVIDNAPYLHELERVMRLISKPTMIFHGARDPFSTTTQAEKLQSASGARKKQFYIIPGAEAPSHAPLCHWAGPLYFSTIRSFIDTTCGSNTWRQRRRERKQQ